MIASTLRSAKKAVGNMFKRRGNASARRNETPLAQIIPRSEHSVTRKAISHSALKVLYRLRDNHYDGYLVGGCIRDLLCGRAPKDFDIATNATPEQVRELFRNSRIIGRRFRLVHVVFGREVIEVATFRSPPRQQDLAVTGRIASDNVFGTLEDDVARRDFTINSLYYEIKQFSIVDHFGGIQDLEAQQIRLIGDPATRYAEDPVRALRAARFAGKLGFGIETHTRAAIADAVPLLAAIPPARLFDETLKLFLSGHARGSLQQLRELGLLVTLLPDLPEQLDDDVIAGFVDAALANTDARVAADKPVTPAFLFAALLWPSVSARADALRASENLSPLEALQAAGDWVLARQAKRTALPKRFAYPAREIWNLQERLFAQGNKALRVLSHPRFRAGFDLLALRAEAGFAESGELAKHVRRWEGLQAEHPEMVGSRRHSDEEEKAEADGENRRPRRRRPRRRRETS